MNKSILIRTGLQDAAPSLLFLAACVPAQTLNADDVE